MSWIVLVALVAASAAALWLMRVRQGLLTAAIAALMLGASGYALQGRPSLAGHAATGIDNMEYQSLTQLRHAFFGNFSAEESWMSISEALASHGNTEDAVNILQNAVRRYPADPQLWIGLGNALVEHSHGTTPPADYAYRRAASLLPGHPAPRFFYDLALVRSGVGEPAVQDMIALMQENPKASWRPVAGATLLELVANSERGRPAKKR